MMWCNSSDTVGGEQRVDSQCRQGGVDWIIKAIYIPQWQKQPQATNELIYRPTGAPEVSFFKTGQEKKIYFLMVKYCSNTSSSNSISLFWSWTAVWVVLAGLHREERAVKTGMLTLSCHCHAVHKVPRRSVTTHSSHLVEHVPVHSQTAFPSCHLSRVL